jgi:FkbM family methyltransferase
MKRWLALRPARFDRLVEGAFRSPNGLALRRIRRSAQVASGVRPGTAISRAYASAFLDNIGAACARIHRATGASLELGSAPVGFDDVTVDCRSGYGYTANVYLQGLDDIVMFDLFRVVLKNGDTALDVGANEGMHTCVLGRCVGPSGRVQAYEPVPANVRRLESNIRLNGLGNVTVRPVGVADRSGMLPFSFTAESAHNTGMSRFDPAATTSIPVVALDDDIPENCELNLIKIDVEGIEPGVLRGAQRLLAQYRPFVVLEYNRLVWDLGEMTRLIPFEHDTFLKPDHLGAKWPRLDAWSDQSLLPEASDILIVPRDKRAAAVARLA